MKRLLILALVVTILAPFGAGHAQEDDEVARLMEDMSSAAKVGQLFLVAFPGAEVTDDALIAELIRDYHVGGVILLPENGNIVNEGDTPLQVATLASQLQEATWEATQPTTETLAPPPGPFIPLFIAVHHEGNGAPYTGIVNGTTPLPSEMTLGATWDPAHAETVGQIAGQELHTLGINMLLGPSLDVLEIPRPESAGDLGVRTFGGEPFWVGQMGQAYIRGVHEGGDGQVAVVAKHFPGLGASDRSLDEEVSTVQRTLEKLRQVDLTPFFTVAQSEDPLDRPDGVLVSHIRFRGLEGDRFATTRPISVDSQWLQRLLGLPELTGWREEGGVTVSDGLGVRALRRFYDPNEESFNNRRIAQEAFLAGNDILILSQFALGGDWGEQATNIKSTITFFQERYESDPSFQTRVDEAVARILRLKLRLYNGSFRLSAAQPNVTRVGERVGLSQEMLAPISRDAITLLSPPSPDLVPPPPTVNDNIVIFTDSRSGQPCATCAPIPYIDPFALRDTITQLYGPRGTGQISTWRMQSFTFEQLDVYLSAPPPTAPGEEGATPTPPDPVEPALQNADWIIFAMLDPADGSPQPGIVRRFLAERADALQALHLIVVAYDAPYYLDATEINKLGAYYVAYSRTEPFIETSVRAMFGEFAPAGMPPVSVPGVNYDLAVRTSPNPAQTIVLHYEIVTQPEEGQPTLVPTPEDQPTPEPKPEAGTELRLYTGVIIDHNGHPVPDGTPVQFIFTYPQEAHESSVTATTHGGVAETMLTLNRTGQLDISIQADPVPRAVALQITIQEGETVVSTPTLPPTLPTATPVPTANPEPTPVETPSPTPEAENGEEKSEAMQGPGILDLALALTGVLIVGGVGYYLVRSNSRPVSQALRLALWCAIGGLALYLAYALPVPGAAWLREISGVWAAGWVTLIGGAVPLIIAWAVAQRRRTEED